MVNYFSLTIVFKDMVEFARAVQEFSRPATADSTSTTGESEARSTTSGNDKNGADKKKKDKDDDEPMALD